jgi:hypothetical protein
VQALASVANLRQQCIVRLICDRSKLRAWRVPGLHGDTPGRGALGSGAAIR